jgi:hypothetical protein
MFEFTFGSAEADSQEPEDTLTSTITQITSMRESPTVTVEEGGIRGNRAHITSYVAVVAGIERLFIDQTWLGAYTELHDLWVFSRDLLASWYADPTLSANATDPLKMKLTAEAKAARKEIDTTYLNRDGVDLDAAWFIEPNGPMPEVNYEGRKFFDHEPSPTEYNPKKYKAPRRWRPNLGTAFVGELNRMVTEWVQFRNRWPWTSVNADSWVTGEVAAVKRAEAAANAVSNPPKASQLTVLARELTGTFDFFPDTLDAGRTASIAAGVAARHVVEEFQYHPEIEPAWRDRVAAEFLSAWEVRVADDISKATRNQTFSGTQSNGTPRDTRGLKSLQKQWKTVVEPDFMTYYNQFKTAL